MRHAIGPGLLVVMVGGVGGESSQRPGWASWGDCGSYEFEGSRSGTEESGCPCCQSTPAHAG